ncbi:PEP-CTERM sorting domain-containing protein [Crateriforma conspicua]|uniref:PEP-CTERM sorting domain-containing protein n=1 Tax=Crateriforma conspicua TaxID=2527996 RepID=UPI0018C8ABEB|nr:PEP-CTERM sorting domain-containing protein [Crateriforma conspicua]
MMLTAGNASAAFVLIDNFNGASTDTAAVRSTTGAVGAGSIALTAGDTLSYSNVNGISFGGLAGIPSTTLRLNGISPTGAGIVMTASVNGGTALNSNPFTPVGGFVEWTFAGIDPATVTNIDFAVLVGDFTANGVYAVPEPTTMALIGLAGAGGALGVRRRRKAAAAC